MALTEQEKQIVLFGQKSGKKPDEIQSAVMKYRQEQSKVAIDSSNTQEQPGYLSRVVSGVKSAFGQAKEDVTSTDNRSALSKGVATVSDVASGVVTPLTEAPVLKQVGEVFGKSIDFLGNKLSDLYNPKFQQDLSNMSPEEFSKASQPLKDLANLGNISNNILLAKGVTKAGEVSGKGIAKGANVASDAVSGAAKQATEAVNVLKEKTVNTIDNATERIISPDVSLATKVSLNPMEALKGTGQDFQISVGGKVKKISELTPEEASQVKLSTSKSMGTFTKQAEKFANDRSVIGGSPVEIVGNRTDKALNFADKKRQVIGQRMGEIEQKYVNDQLPIGERVLSQFSETIKNFENPKFGVDTADAPIIRKLVTDFDNLNSSGATVGERLDFIRSWDKYLKDSKDAFGNFKENSTVNTRIQNAVRELKNETVDAIATKDKIYKGLRTQYSIHKQLQKIGDQLLGKDGALGEKIKGAATVKRAIQSNSDAGARQFLVKLKEITGYDAIRDGDLALTAMENIGDYQGLSLLNIIKEGKTGIINKVLEKVQDFVVGNKADRVKKYIRK